MMMMLGRSFKHLVFTWRFDSRARLWVWLARGDGSVRLVGFVTECGPCSSVSFPSQEEEDQGGDDGKPNNRTNHDARYSTARQARG